MHFGDLPGEPSMTAALLIADATIPHDERGLLPDDPPQWIRDRLIGEGRTILIVGHMPYLPRLLQMLTGAGDERALSFPLHGCVALEADREQWKEGWRLES